MKERNTDKIHQHEGETVEQQEHRTNHDAQSWVRKYLDLADRAMTGNSNEESGHR